MLAVPGGDGSSLWKGVTPEVAEFALHVGEFEQRKREALTKEGRLRA